MSRIALFASLATILAAGALAQPASAGATSCQTVNGRTTCVHSEKSLSCQTIEGRTTCIEGSGAQIFGPAPRIVIPEDKSTDSDDDDGATAPLTIERGAGGLHIRSGGLDIRLP